MGSKPWGDGGNPASWLVDWNNLQEHQLVDLVVDVLSHDNDHILGLVFPCQTRVRLVGSFHELLNFPSIAVFGAVYNGEKGIHQFFVGTESQLLKHRPIEKKDLSSMIELCSGMGWASFGFQHVGFDIALGCDHKQSMLDGYAMLHPSSKTVLGEVGQKAVIAEIHEKAPNSRILSSGFSCQPFSGGGQQRGVLDKRAGSLRGTLVTAFYLRIPVIILECVTQAASNNYVKGELNQFCRQCGYVMSEQILELGDVWCSKRDRWWAVVVVKSLGQIRLHDFPKLCYPSAVKHMIPRPLNLSDDDLQQLQIVGQEWDRFVRFANVPDMVPSLNSKCPTALHSWGSQMVGCKCGCRNEGFSDDTLLNRGVYGIVFPVFKGGEAIGYRHPHPTEVALLTGCPIPATWPGCLRLSLAALGQQAAPMQALWIGGCVAIHIQKLCVGIIQIDLNAKLDAFRALMVAQHKERFDHHPAQPIVHIEVEDRSEGFSGSMVTVLSPEPTVSICDSQGQACMIVRLASNLTTVRELMVAERRLDPCEGLIEVLDCQSGVALVDDDHVSGRRVWFRPLLSLCDALQSVDDDPYLMEASDGETEATLTLPMMLADRDMVNDQEGDCVMEVEETSIVSGESLDLMRDDSEPLLNMPADVLKNLKVPVVTSLSSLVALKNQVVSSALRRRLLQHQGHLWADDEITWHVSEILKKVEDTKCVLMDPILASAMLDSPNHFLLHAWFQQLGMIPDRVVTVVWIDSHWVPVVWSWTKETLMVRSWDVDQSSMKRMSRLNDAVSKMVGSRTWMVHFIHRGFALQRFCGVCAVRFLDNEIRGQMLPTCEPDAEHLQMIGKCKFDEHLVATRLTPRPWVWGSGFDPHARKRLVDLLKQHGVPADQVESRIGLALQALGLGPVQSAVLSGSPWRGLKALGNQARPTFAWVLPSELEEVVKLRAEAKSQAGKRPRPSRQPVRPAQIDPHKVALEADAFVSASGAPLTQIPPTQLSPMATGVAVANLDEVEQFLKNGVTIAPEALGILLLNQTEDVMPTTLSWQQIRTVVRCQSNGEPLIVNAVLVQLGQCAVVNNRKVQAVEPQGVPAACVKVSLYRDQMSDSWDEVVARPVKVALDLIPQLRVCNQADCNCSCWHPDPSSDIREPLFDVWRRQWVNLSYKQVAASQADIFIVNFRFAKSCEVSILASSGSQGVFFEPRSLDGRSVVNEYQTIWLPKATLPELLHLQKINHDLIGVTRMGSRLGVRVLADKAKEVASALKPGSIVLAVGTRQSYHVGPLPFGMDRASVAKLLQSWKWQARPVNPAKAVVGELGTLWLVQSSVDPPSNVFGTKNGDVVITKLGQKETKQEVPAVVVGNTQTMEMCSKAQPDKSGTDPWLKQDPWQVGIQSLAVSGPRADDMLTSLKSVEARIEERVEQALRAKLPSVSDMEVDSMTSDGSGAINDSRHTQNEARLSVLEQQVQALSATHRHFEQKVDGQFTQLHSQVNAQATHMEDLFTKQMSQIEALLAKKARCE